MAGCDMESQMSGISPQQVRLGFIRKVYGIVCAQVTATSIFAGACVAGPLREPMVAFAQHRPGLLQWGTLIASLLALLLCRVGKDRYPLNLVGLGLLTSVMAVDVGVISAMVSSIGLGMLVVEAALITGLLTAGLTLYTFRSKRDFSFLGAALWPLLFALCCFSLLSVFFPSLRMGWMNLIVSFAGASNLLRVHRL
ncbi:unnamed protein product [Effrenium voratum]|uniref:Uncharacterized protein n=1 Tax=Effrenium voratum TaxID=2562239 RepID=A0AA36IYB4_9DINO|nr:unnamed protein product [Effrenium voratum]